MFLNLSFSQDEDAIPAIPLLELEWEASGLGFKASLGYIEKRKSYLKVKMAQA